MKIVLYGCKAVGKTTTGSALAKILSIPHLDSDWEMEKTHGKTIREIYQTFGENKFRELERQTIVKIASTPDCIISLGGGSLMNPSTKDALRGSLFMHLYASPEYLWERVKDNPPAFLQGNPEQCFIDLSKKRLIQYRAFADHEIDVTGKTSLEICQRIANYAAACYNLPTLY